MSDQDNLPVAAVWTCPRPCPFCGVAAGVQETSKYRVECLNCGSMGPNAVDRPQAIRLWNMRKTP